MAERTRQSTRSGRTWRDVLVITLLVAAVYGVGVAAEPEPTLQQTPFAKRSGPRGATLFTPVAPAQSGIKTENAYADPEMWGRLHQEFEVGAMGTGVALGDFDHDGRPDVFVVSKTESSRLFRNLGDWKFEDVTERAGVADRGAAAKVWKQGATFADVNNDGWLDLYVCRFNAPNLLYINRGNGTFVDEATERGLAVTDASAVGAFADYDRDGWLDVFVLTNLLDHVAKPAGQRSRLFRNRGDGTFEEATDKAGIEAEGQGHSATWWDFDQDGWPDLYVAYDFARPDRLYRNRGDGTFHEVLDSVVPHQPYSSMGADLGDVNNDGWMDLLVAEMAATTPEKDQRAMAASRANMAQEPPDGSPAAPQVLRNALYLNTGKGRMLETACLAGIAATDWTWSVRWEDLDQDGWLDLHVTNGMHRESHNVDLLAQVMTAPNPGERARLRRAGPVLAEANLAFRGGGKRGDVPELVEVGAAWGLNEVGVSFGAAFGDLDGDGDLDLVYTNYEKGATVLRNDLDTGNSIVVALRGTTSNRYGVGARVTIETAAGSQVRVLTNARGYLSSSQPVLHFGVGAETLIQRLTVTWPNGGMQTWEGLEANRAYTLTERATALQSAAPSKSPLFREVSEASGFSFTAREAPVDERRANPLLPMRLNRRGPALAIGDVDGDGRNDVVMGGTTKDLPRILRTTTDGKFVEMAFPDTGDRMVNDGPMLLFDADGDGADDLLVTRSGVAQPAGAAGYQPRLYLNDGRGLFRPAPDSSLPRTPWSVGAVGAADFDRDGRLDLFVGGRVVPGAYPTPPRSAILRNADGRFEDVTDQMVPALRSLGLVTASLWSDWDGDGWTDLLVACEWGLVHVFRNRQGSSFEDATEASGFAAAGTGWWSSLAAGDFNEDGRPDYAVGNVGLNTPYRATPDQPALLFVGDFRGDDTEQLIEAYHDRARIVPRRSRKELGAAVPALLRRYPKNNDFARASLADLLGAAKLSAAQRFAATELQSGVFLSRSDGAHQFAPLPRLAQIAPLYGMVVGDFDADGNMDLYGVQNSHAPAPVVGRFDGGLSQLLRGDGTGSFTPVPIAESGLLVPGDAKALATIDLGEDGSADFLVTRNNATSLAFRHSAPAESQPLFVQLRGRRGNHRAIGARLLVEFADGSKQWAEVQSGCGYFSQCAPGVFLGNPPGKRATRITVFWPEGGVTQHPLSEPHRTVVLQAPTG